MTPATASKATRHRANLAAALGAGLLFGVGLTLSGMTRPRKVIGFLDFFGGAWDPSLVFVMGGAVAVTLVGFRAILKRRAPLAADAFVLPAKTAVDARIVAGGAVFGVGWGLGGFCPGPGIVSLASGATSPLVFVASMVAGMLLFEALAGVRNRAPNRTAPPRAEDDEGQNRPESALGPDRSG